MGISICQPVTFLFIFFFFFRDRVSLSQTGTHSVDQAGLELISSYLCLPSAGIKGECHHCPADCTTHVLFYFVL